MSANTIKIALVGNPNTGKTSLFNALTGLNQQVGNYPGITVDRKTGSCFLNQDHTYKGKIIDLPGTYSLNPSSVDENVVTELLLDPTHADTPDVLVVVAEIENVKRNLLLYTQIKDLGFPTLLVINMADQMERKGITLDVTSLEKALHTRIILTSTRNGEGIEALKAAILEYKMLSVEPCLDALSFDDKAIEEIHQKHPETSKYKAWLQETHLFGFEQQTDAKKVALVKQWQHKETVKRYQYINEVLQNTYRKNTATASDFGAKLDKILLHPVLGYIVFVGVLLLMFQSIFSWASVVMDFIDESFGQLSELVASAFPEGILNDLITQGIIPGIGGIVIFVPQIALLFLFISLLEESGYMSRVVFLMDKIMRKFGLSGKSVVPLMSGNACAIPAVMAARNIENWKERLITILVTPFTVCSARLPVYTIIIALVIPSKTLWGVFDYRALALMGMYFFGIIAAILAATILNQIIKLKTKSYFVVEMPTYKMPLFKNVGFTVFEKTKAFVFEAGKIILAISIILWFMASHGPGDQFENAAEIVQTQNPELTDEALEVKIAAHQLQHSYIGILGTSIEPAIRPLGYDWKIGIALLTSFAAREVFVGTLGVIYSVGESDDEENTKIRDKMAAEIHPETGKKIFDLPTGISLLFFYALAMQCMATVAIVKRETNSWKWPLIQLVFMTGAAYIMALLAYQILS
jgi:ferrous iron transport protein B